MRVSHASPSMSSIAYLLLRLWHTHTHNAQRIHKTSQDIKIGRRLFVYTGVWYMTHVCLYVTFPYFLCLFVEFSEWMLDWTHAKAQHEGGDTDLTNWGAWKSRGSFKNEQEKVIAYHCIACLCHYKFNHIHIPQTHSLYPNWVWLSHCPLHGNQQTFGLDSLFAASSFACWSLASSNQAESSESTWTLLAHQCIVTRSWSILGMRKQALSHLYSIHKLQNYLSLRISTSLTSMKLGHPRANKRRHKVRICEPRKANRSCMVFSTSPVPYHTQVARRWPDSYLECSLLHWWNTSPKCQKPKCSEILHEVRCQPSGQSATLCVLPRGFACFEMGEHSDFVEFCKFVFSLQGIPWRSCDPSASLRTALLGRLKVRSRASQATGAAHLLQLQTNKRMAKKIGAEHPR